MNGVFSLKRLALYQFALCALLAFQPLWSSAQEGRRISQVVVAFKGSVAMDEARVRAQMSIREGEIYTKDAEERDIRNLYATGSVDNVEFQTSNVGGGLRVTVTLSGRGGIGEIGFLGNAAFDNDRLRKEAEIKVGDPVDDSKLTTAQQKIRELYEKKGFSDVLVTYDVQPSQTKAGFSAVYFRIEEGGVGMIGDIRFEGNSAISSSKLRGMLKSKEKTFWRLWGKAGKIDNQQINDDVKIIEQAYQDKGYVYVQVSYRRETLSDSRVGLVFEINEGASYDVADVAIEGITVFSKEELTPAIKTDAGYRYSGSDVRGDEKMILDYYGSRGYADARVDTQLSEAGPGKLKVTYQVTEGGKSYIRKVNISGNMKTEDEVIRRELPFAPGDELNTVKLESGKNRLQNMNYFEGPSDPNPLLVRAVPTEVEGFKDIEVSVAEKPTGSVNFGAGFSSIDSLVGFVDVTQTNFDITDWKDFRGAGQRFNMNMRYGLRRRDFSMSLTEPWFMGQKLALTTDLFYRDMYYLSNRFDQRNFGTAIGLRKPLGEHAYAELTYTLQQISIDNVDPTSTLVLQNERGDYLQSKLDFTLVHDTRDSVFVTRRGHKLEGGLLASGLGGDVEVWGGNLAGQQYISLPGDTILSFEGAMRYVQSWGGSGNNFRNDVPIFERLFLGGANNLRGYDYREAGPKDSSGEPLGGNLSLFASVEVSFPIFGSLGGNEKTRLAFFYDVGSVSSDDYNLPAVANSGAPIVGDGTVYSNIGIGLRLFLPIGPIRLDYGFPLQSDPFTGNSGRIQFNMGYKF